MVAGVAAVSYLRSKRREEKRVRRQEAERVDAMLKFSRMALKQRQNKPLAKHAGRTMANCAGQVPAERKV